MRYVALLLVVIFVGCLVYSVSEEHKAAAEAEKRLKRFEERLWELAKEEAANNLGRRRPTVEIRGQYHFLPWDTFDAPEQIGPPKESVQDHVDVLPAYPVFQYHVVPQTDEQQVKRIKEALERLNERQKQQGSPSSR